MFLVYLVSTLLLHASGAQHDSVFAGYDFFPRSMQSLSSKHVRTRQSALARFLLAIGHPTSHARDNVVDDRASAAGTGFSRRALLIGVSTVGMFPSVAHARPEGVNKPELLPSEKTNIIDLQKFLTPGQVTRLNKRIDTLQSKTGFKIRVLTQSYPETPGLAIKDYWGVDDQTVVMVVDKGEGFNRKGGLTNILNFNVGDGFSLNLPNTFFTRLRNIFGVNDFVKKNGIDVAIEQSIETIDFCLKQEDGCADVPDEFKDPGKAMYGGEDTDVLKFFSKRDR